MLYNKLWKEITRGDTLNISKGLYHTIYHPRLVIIPLIVHVIQTFIGVLGIYFGFTLFSIDTQFPYAIPVLNNEILSIYGPYTNNWLLTSIATIIMLLIKSYALSMYLGAMKCFLEGPDNTYSILKIAPYYFKRMIQFSILELLLCSIIFQLTHTFWPLAIIVIFVVLIFSLTPYIVVLEDTTVRDAIVKSPKLLLTNLGALLWIALVSLILTILLTRLPFANMKVEYYIVSLLYSFIGTTMIFAVMNCLYKSIYTFSLPFKKVKKSRKYFPPLWIAALLLPLLGALLVNG
ncbi:hypothetical protein [Fredinandcohnia sp. FSL W7-1320]|uniref:hypothetical protein n=1 Tax=Fredinandcohnia sp. FSL W7-1320 TaxID=2954540 RepID=UPI0030FDF45B